MEANQRQAHAEEHAVTQHNEMQNASDLLTVAFVDGTDDSQSFIRNNGSI